jgi:hypothetical protein
VSMIAFDLIERLTGPAPRRFDPYAQQPHAVIPDPKREKTLLGHVKECHARYVELKTEISEGRIQAHKNQQLLWILIALSVAGNTTLLAKIAGFVAN